MDMRRPRMLLIGLALLAALAITACDVPNVTRGMVRNPNWGANTVRPASPDIPYVPRADRGCPGTLTDDAPCGGSQTLDIYPATRGARGTVVFVHGGGFTGGDKYPLVQLGGILRLTRQGWSVVSVNYRLAGPAGNTFPIPTQDVAAALRWVWTNGVDRGLNVGRVVVVGHSAGGTLAALMGTAGNSGRPEFAGIPPLSGWVSLAGILDLDAGTNSRFWLSNLVGGKNTTARGRLASPLTWWDRADPPGYVAHGINDEWVEHANLRRLRSRAGTSGRVRFDSVDNWADGSSMSPRMRGHMPTLGMNWPVFESWLAGLPRLTEAGKPLGNLDVIAIGARAGTVRAAGWAIDPNTVQPIEVQITIDGRIERSVTANRSRPDVGAAFPSHGNRHGFDVTVATTAGRRQVCVRAVNVGPGPRTAALGCRTLLVR